jgi:hypothetical protein
MLSAYNMMLTASDNMLLDNWMIRANKIMLSDNMLSDNMLPYLITLCYLRT